MSPIYLRLALSHACETRVDSVDIDTLSDTDEDKVYGAMSVAKMISTVGCLVLRIGIEVDAATHA